MKLKITFLLLVINSILFAQPEISWIREYNTSVQDEGGFSVTETNNNDGYVVCGYRNTPVNLQDLFLIRTNTVGDTVWTKEYGISNGSDYGMQILKTGDGYIVGGMLVKPSIYYLTAWIIKIDENGDSLWSRTILDSARIMSICLTPDGGIAATGGQFFNGRNKLFIARFNPEGSLLWLNYYNHGYFYDSFGLDIICTQDSGFAVLGGATDSNTVSTTEPWLLKTDGNGNAELDTLYDLSNDFMDGNIQQTNSGDFIIAEDLMDAVSFLKINNNGEILDSLNFMLSSVVSYPEIIQAEDSNYICMYSTFSDSSGSTAIIFQKTDQNFNNIWTKDLSGSHDYLGISFILTGDNGLVVTGYSYNSSGADILLAKLEGDITPVELISFQGNIEGNNVILNWKTATENNNRGFDIERSPDKNNWNKIGFVEGKITSTTPHTYSFMDSSIQSGVVYYRLKQIDLNGSFVYSDEIKLEFSPVIFSLEQNYPNPFNPVTTINYSIPFQENVKLEVYNILGQKVAALVNEVKPPGKYSADFYAGSFASGIYIYQLTAGKNTLTRKMLLLK